MRYRLLALALVFSVAGLLIYLSSGSWRSKPDETSKERTHTFRLIADAEIATAFDEESAKVRSEVSHVYSWQQKGNERTLRLHRMSLKLVAGERKIADWVLDRKGQFGISQGQPVAMSYDTASEEYKRTLNDTFGTPLYKIEVDEMGKVVRQTTLAGPGAKAVGDGQIVADLLLFHPPYSVAQDEWSAEVETNAGDRQRTGKLNYKKEHGRTDGQAVKVSGALRLVGEVGAGSDSVVSGLMVYDPKLREWIAGEIEFDMSVHRTRGGQLVTRDDGAPVVDKGKMKLAFQLLPKGEIESW